MYLTLPQKREKKGSGTWCLPIKTKNRSKFQRELFQLIVLLFTEGRIHQPSKGGNTLGGSLVKEIELSLEDETPTLMRNRLSNALLFNYVRAVGAEACSLAEAIKCHIYCIIILSNICLVVL